MIRDLVEDTAQEAKRHFLKEKYNTHTAIPGVLQYQLQANWEGRWIVTYAFSPATPQTGPKKSTRSQLRELYKTRDN